MREQAPPGSDRVRIEIELDAGADPIAGSLSTGGISNRFDGWLALTEMIERARTATHEAGVAEEEAE